jgi:uncharacterized protein YndB with AHSA1/START domain
VAHPFELTHEMSVQATPEQVWHAITSGPEIDSWFMGRNEVEPRVGGTTKLEHAGFTMEATVSAWEPPTRFAFRSPEADDGAFHVFDYLIEPKAPGSSVRWVHSGALGPDWEAEYEGMSEGDPMYFHKLGEYLTYFLDRTATPIDAFGPRLEDAQSWEVFREPLGLEGPADVDDRVSLTPEGLDPIEGVVDYRSRSFFGVRTDDAMYRFIRGFDGTLLVGHHLFGEGVDRATVQDAWQAWITRAFA